MASPVADIGQSHQHHPVSESAADSAFLEAQKWIEAVTGRCFGDKDFRGGLENGILLCELLNCIKPGLVKKINRLQTPIAGLDNLSVFLRGCEELGLKGSQLFDPGNLQDTSTRPNTKGSDCSRKLKNVLITIYWLGCAANSCTSYSGPTLNLKEFEGLLSQMRKEAEEAESPKRSIRDSGYIDCWDSERSDSLSPPRHGREDSFDSLDSFGSRSRQTPSPDILVARGSSDGRGSDSESDAPLHRKIPDVRKDDMSARRTSVSELRTVMPFNQYLPNKSNQSGYMPTPLRKKRSDKEEGGQKSWSTATSPVGGERPFSTPARSCSEELFHQPPVLAAYATVVATSPVCMSTKHPLMTDREELGLRKGSTGVLRVADAERDDMWTRQTLSSPKHATTLSPTHFLPVPATLASTTITATNTGQRKSRTLSESGESQGMSPWLDNNLPATSVSMIDMRGEEEAILQPHSQVRHELMHNQYNKMKEEDDHWQDDLARWKSRRRSISQDLIKKEEERKTMERLMSGEICNSQRRRSIKTYREIVEDKERREEQLREAYNKAKTPEEASSILQRYAQRFSISETVLERLQLPKLLDRRISADASSPFPISLSPSPTTPDPFDMDPNGPMKYLRQQSAPAPKFTSTVEARIEEFSKDLSSQHRPQIRSRSSEPPSTRALSPKPVPLLTPKPYLQSWPTGAEPRSSKVDGLLRVNGDLGCDDVPTTPESQGRESPPDFQPSPSNTSNSAADVPTSAASHTHNTHTSTAAGSPASTKAKDTQGGAENIHAEKVDECSIPPSRPTSLPTELQKQGESFVKSAAQQPSADLSTAAIVTPSEVKQTQERTELPSQNIPTSSLVQSEVSTQKNQPVTSQISKISQESQTKESMPSLSPPWSFGNNPPCERRTEEAQKDHRGNEKYQCEQEKLKEEWEKAQKEVAEEERKYHEEERRILEETVTPLTPRSSALPSPIRGELLSASEPQDTIVRSLADWERKQELLEQQSRGSTESVEWKRRENDRTSDISTADDSMKTGRSSFSQTSSQAELHGLQNGQKAPQVSAKTQSPVKKQTADNNKPCRPAGDRRSVSGKKLCSSCGQPLGKGAAMIIETLSLYFHIHCFKCGVCKGQLGDTTTGTDVRIKNGLLNCHQCYIRSRSAGQPTTL